MFELMSPQSGMNDSNDNNKNGRRTKPISSIHMAGAVVTAAILLSGLSLITSFQPVMAQQQQNITEGGGGGAASTDNTTSATGGATQGENTTSAGKGGANQSTSEVRMNLEQARAALQNNDTQGATMYLDMAL